ncbi:MAG: mannose-1-phosphate guanylyltransferase [Balneolaceae bacterium]
MIYAVVMAGGSGTRFWPKSTKKRPKQFLNFFGEKTMIEETVNRLKGFVEPEQVMVVTNDNYRSIVEELLPSTNTDFIIGEPVAKNTAPCVAAAAALLHKKDPDSTMIVLPADHLIGKPKEFLRVLDSAVKTAQQEESLVTIGITPNRPETGYGYIQFDKSTEIKAGEHPAYSVKNFREKPDVETAKQFLESGDFLWNSGMFIWKTSVILDEFKNHLPDMYKCTEKLMESDCGERDLNQFYHACESISIDYGIMEKAEKVHVVPGEFEWNDVGSWTAVHELSKKDEDGNVFGKSPISLQGATSNLIYSESGKMISLVGVDNVAVVETENAILVVNLDKSQDVKKVVEDLKSDPEKEKFL